MYKLLGKIVRKVRIYMRLSQEEYAEYCGVTWENVIRVESGIRPHKIYTHIMTARDIELRFY